MAIAGARVAMSTSNVPLGLTWVTSGGRKKKPGVPPSWPASLISAAGAAGPPASRCSEQAMKARVADRSSARRKLGEAGIGHPL